MRPDILEFLHQAVRYSSSEGVDRYNILLDIDYLSLYLLRGHIIFVFDRYLFQFLQLDHSDALRLNYVLRMPELLELLLLLASFDLLLLCSRFCFGGRLIIRVL